MTDLAQAAMDTVPPIDGNAHAFAVWAPVYDRQKNPLIALEERYLPLMLPDSRGEDIIDVGCGTGRWLSHLVSRSPRYLHGIDASPEMLHEALKKNILNVQLSLATCDALPVRDDSADLVLCSFVASYVEDLTNLAKELYRITRKGGDVFVTDMHPDTANQLGWKRGFHVGNGRLHAQSLQGTIQETLRIFREAGFFIRTFIEPGFGEPERHIFAEMARLEQFQQATDYPAIYLLHLHKDLVPTVTHDNERQLLLLEGARYALGPNADASGSICIEKGRLESLGSKGLDTQR